MATLSCPAFVRARACHPSMSASTSTSAFAPACPRITWGRRVPPKSATVFRPRHPNLTLPEKSKTRFRTAVSASAYAKTWSNPSGAVLTCLVKDTVWAAERPFIWNTIDVGGKMGVVRLANGDVWVHSPVYLDASTKAAVDAIGPVKHVVSPNYEHVTWASEWKRAYPSATLYGCPGMKNKEPGIPWDVEIIDGDCTFPGDEFSAVCFDGAEKNPFTNKPFFNECVCLHKPSGVLFVTDIVWNYPNDVPLKTAAWKFGMDRVYKPFYENAMVVPERYLKKKKQLLALRFDKVLPCHGTFVATAGARMIKQALM